MNELLVVDRRAFYEFCAALRQFPDWDKVQDWIAANQIVAPPELPTVDDVADAPRPQPVDGCDCASCEILRLRPASAGSAELVDRLETIIATLRELRGLTEKTAAIAEVFDQFAGMMGAGPGPALDGVYVPNVGPVNVLSQAGQ